ncbi:PQQ-dependent sugar dehydrogenase [Actinoplanes solisilvae]|uniref:PQQ-dependent sugar dehydrogenase n=1 Tax=Actinoplanes solisilvae TaxID=2486853 RepID=UPI001F0CC796|nr:gluconolaconase [Actinoplanes solisilvae]
MRTAPVKTIVRVFACGLLLTGCSSPTPTEPPPPGLVSTEVQLVDDPAGTPLEEKRQILAPQGWTVSLWARVPSARLLAWTPDGRLLVSRPRFGDVLALTPGSGKPAQTTLVDGLNQPHGLAFDGDTLYVAESDQVDAFTYRAGSVSGRRVLVSGLPDEKNAELGGKYAHALKTVVVGKDKSLYFSIGSTGNISAADRSEKPERAAILRVRAGGGEPAVFARGVRNGTGLAVAPDGAVWTAVNNRDNIAYPSDFDDRGEVDMAYVNDHPLEPLARLDQGRDLGWPYCNPEPDLRAGDKESPLSYTNRPFTRDYQTNPDGTKLDCSKLPPVEQGLGAHSAPLGLSFASDVPGGYGTGALVGVHGSWNRQPPRQPEVSFFAWRDGKLGPQQTLLGGFQLPDGSRWGRPVMAVQGPDGALYVSDDYAGAVYRVSAKR